MTLKEAKDYGIYFLSANGVDEAEFKSLCLVCHLAGIKNNEYQNHINDEIIMKRFADLLWRVKNGEPLQYVIGKWDFYNSEFFVGKGVLIPRPETEEITELVIKKAKGIDNPVIFDLCSGSGCIGISIAKEVKNSTVYLIEKSPDAFIYLMQNKENVNNSKAVMDDIKAPSFDYPLADIIVSNPPYIKTEVIEGLQDEVKNEPFMALDGGDDGLDFYRAINDIWHKKLKPNGLLFLEIGNEQGNDVKNLLTNFKNIEILKDIYNNVRMILAINLDSKSF